MRPLITALLIAAPSAALAQDDIQEGDTVIYQQKTVVSFDGDTIDGDLTRPDGEFIESRKRIRHSNLIKIRDNFRMRILQSVSEL